MGCPCEILKESLQYFTNFNFLLSPILTNQNAPLNSETQTAQ